MILCFSSQAMLLNPLYPLFQNLFVFSSLWLKDMSDNELFIDFKEESLDREVASDLLELLVYSIWLI